MAREPPDDRSRSWTIQVRHGVIFLRACRRTGYDVPCRRRVQGVSPTSTTPSSNPKNFRPPSRSWTSAPTSAIIPPNSFRGLASTIEYFRIPARQYPDRVPRQVHLRPLRESSSTLTPFEPEWEGQRHDREISNTTPLPAIRIYANEGIAQVLFFQGDEAVREVVQGQERASIQAQRRC